MHLLAARPGGFNHEEGIVDLQQTPGDIVILSAQDTSLGLLADVADTQPGDLPSIRLANLVNLTKPAAYDLYEDKVLQHAQLIIVSLLGGVNYWKYGVERLAALCMERNIPLVMVPGDDQPDPDLDHLSNQPRADCYTIWRYLREGGRRNTENLLQFIKHLLDTDRTDESGIDPARTLPNTLIHSADGDTRSLTEWQEKADSSLPALLLLFYRSHVQSGNTGALERFIEILGHRFNVLPVATLSLKNQECLGTINHLIAATDCRVVINTTSFSQRVEGNAALSSEPQSPSRLFEQDIPVIQAILAANSEDDWRQSNQGLRSRDIAMNIALPEYDGRIVSRAISFKELHRHSSATQLDIIRYRLNPERAEFVAALAENWSRLGCLANSEKRIALVLANYPTRDGRIGNGVGLDTPASVITILQAMRDDGYSVTDIPKDGDELIQRLQSGITNNLDLLPAKQANQRISRTDYLARFETLPESCRVAVLERWGSVDNDPMLRDGMVMVSGIQLGGIFIGIQPARGYNMDVVANYHDPDLVPPHGYLAFYFWIRSHYGAHALSHVGKHGNLEWLPGKSVALSESCWPDAVFGPLPHLYPFIVNDPGEGAQAKRRSQAVILDHLMPPMARAEIYGELLELECLVDEYYQAMGLDERRQQHLREKILAALENTNLIKELPRVATDDDTLLSEVDTYLCDLKEAQIRNGLHRFGKLPEPGKLPELLVSLVRLPRGEGKNEAGILHCLSQDLELQNIDHPFDPLKFDAATAWKGNRPETLKSVTSVAWRTEADTRERLELLAEQCMEQSVQGKDLSLELVRTRELLEHVKEVVLDAVKRSGRDEIKNFMGALNGGFVPAGPSGAPTRGRLDVLPTGRNFYSLDSRSIPTRSAWELGQRSAEQLIQRHLQEHGEHPRQLGLSVWGTSTMRTGGDDIAQGLALMGVRPIWAEGSNRVVDVEIIPGFQLGRPRVDVTLRISGFFRDAFPNVARLFDTAVQTLAEYEEPGDTNVLRDHIQDSYRQLVENGMAPEQAETQSKFRIFGSKPGSYGAGLQGLIDEGIWKDGTDLAQAYINWGGYSYSKDNFGQAAFASFENRLSQIDIVVQNQDNREHDLLDSDDYYQFQGGMSNAVEILKGAQPVIYHGDHANPADPRIRTLKEELNRVIRSRVTNPKWISAMQEHGYKGAFEMAASVDYIFAYDATTNLIDDYQYEAVTDALILDETNREFMEKSNPNALKEMAERLLEAQQRGLWQEPGNYRDNLVDTVLNIDNSLEVNM